MIDGKVTSSILFNVIFYFPGCHTHSSEKHAFGESREICEAKCTSFSPPKHPLSPSSPELCCRRKELRKSKLESDESLGHEPKCKERKTD